MTDTALELAHAALCTPSLDASDSLDVLVDVLLEQDRIAMPGLCPPQIGSLARAFLRRKAWAWAQGGVSREFTEAAAAQAHANRAEASRLVDEYLSEAQP